jgi:hypothetical protein
MGHRLLQVSLTYLRDLALQQMEFDDMSSLSFSAVLDVACDCLT